MLRRRALSFSFGINKVKVKPRQRRQQRIHRLQPNRGLVILELRASGSCNPVKMTHGTFPCSQTFYNDPLFYVTQSVK